MKRFLSGLCLLFFFLGLVHGVCPAHRTAKESERITFEISVVRKSGPSGPARLLNKDRFEVEVRIINDSDEELYFERPVRFSNLHFVIMDASGENVQMSRGVLEPSVTQAYFVRIHSRGAYAETYDLLDSGPFEFGYRFERGRRYNIYATYSTGSEWESFKRLVEDHNAVLFKGLLESDIRSFTW